MKVVVSTLAAMMLGGLFLSAYAAAPPAVYPSRPIRLIVPAVPGVAPDVVARLLGERLHSAVGQVVVVENRPGAIGSIGLTALARATPDGHTVGILALPFVIAPSLLPQVQLEIERDLAPVSLLCWNHGLIVVPAHAKVQSIPQLIALAGTRPGAVRFASTGNATPAHIAGELMKREWGVRMTHLPYKGGVAAATAVITGEADWFAGTVSTLSPFIQSGKLRALATIAPQRLTAYPALPTLIESGYAKLELSDWQAVVAPAATPRHLIARLHTEIAKILDTSDMQQRLDTLGMPAANWGPQRFAPYLQAETRRWNRFVRDMGMKAD